MALQTGSKTVLSLMVAALFVACSVDDKTEPSASSTAKIVEQDVPMAVSLPIGGLFSRVVLGAEGGLHLTSHANVQAGVDGQLTNAGALATSLDSHSSVHGNLLSQAQVQLAPDVLLNGFLTTSQPVLGLSGATVTGPVVENVVLLPATIFDSTVSFGASTTNVTVPKDGSVTLAPGAYNALKVGSGASLLLDAGTYTVDSLEVVPTGTLVVNTAQGAVLLYVRSALNWKGVTTVVGPGGSFLLAYLGTQTVDLKGRLDATVLAPNATLKLNNQENVRGVYLADSLEVGAQATVIHEPFQYWGLVFPPTPTLKCVTRFTDTHYSALFGYVNDFDIDLNVPIGELNRIEPALEGREPITTFEPGVHSAVFFAPFDGTPITWILGDQSVTATADTPRCTLPDYPPSDAVVVLDPEESAGPAGPSLSSRFVPDQLGPGRKVEPGPLPWGQISSATSALDTLAVNAPFRLTITGGNMYGSDDGCGRPELYVKVFIEGSFQGRWDFPECPAVPAACGSDFDSVDFDFSIPTDQENVSVVVELWEEDGGLCGSDDHYADAHLTVSNANGIVTGTVNNFDSDGEDAELVSTVPFGPADCLTTVCTVENLGSRFEFQAKPVGKPRVCTNWNARFVDSGFGEDFATGTGLQAIPASFALARVVVARAGVDPVVIPVVLDEDGCLPHELSPDLPLLVDPAASGLTLTMELTSQFCLDDAGLNCLDLAQNPIGRRFVVGPNTTGIPVPPMNAVLPVSPITLCNLITQDASLNLPSCQVRKVADGAFSAWFGKLPPSRIVLDHSDEDDVTRVSAVVSHLLLREDETNGEIGITQDQIEIMTNVSCDFGTDGVGTCASDPIRIESAPGCTGSEPPEQCLNSDTRWKTIVTHEIGHVLQRHLTGRWRGIYEFANDADDHPGAPFLCQCQHISAINTLHCLQSLEKPGAAQVEGYAHYVVGRTWNALEQSDCVFPYYKHFLSPTCVVNPADCTPDPVSGLVVNSPPVATSCIDPLKWRNNRCLSGTFQPGEVPTDLSVEMDWMGFYYKLTNPVTPARFTVSQLAQVYITTCAFTTGNFCNNVDVEPGWRTIPGTSPPVQGIRDGAEALLVNGTITAEQRTQLLQMGNTFGVSEATAP